MLFIGGSKDGLRIEIKDDREEIYFQILPKEQVFVWEEKKGKEVPKYKVERYKCHRIGGNSCTFKVMVIENFTGNNLIESLIENYNPKN